MTNEQIDAECKRLAPDFRAIQEQGLVGFDCTVNGKKFEISLSTHGAEQGQIDHWLREARIRCLQQLRALKRLN